MKDIEYYIDLLIEADNDRKMKRVVDKLLKEKTTKFEDKNNLISQVFKQHPECLEYVDYDILKKHSTFSGADKSSELLATMLETSETNASDIKDKEDFYARYVSGSLRQCDDQTFVNYIFDENKPEVDMSLFKNPSFIKTPRMIEKCWEKIEANLKSTTDGATADGSTTDGATTETESYDKEFVVDVFAQHMANLDQDKRVNEVVDFIGMKEVDFSNAEGHDILSVLNKNASLKKEAGVINALVKKGADSSTNFDFKKFQDLVAKNKTAFNEYLKKLPNPPAPAASDATTAPAKSEKIITLESCLAKMKGSDPTLISKVYELMSRENAEKFSTTFIEAKSEIYESKKCPKNVDNSLAYVENGGDMDKIPSKLRKKDDLAEGIAEYYVGLIDKKEALPDWLNEENKYSALIDKMQSFNKKAKNNKEIIGAIKESDSFKDASLDHKREFFAKLDQRYLVEERTNIIKEDPACLFVKVKDHSYTFLVEKSGDCGKKDLENLSIAALKNILKPEEGTVERKIKDFAGCLPNEILSDKKVIKNMIDECRDASSGSKKYVEEFFGNLDYQNKSVKENIGKMMRLAATTNPEVLKTVKGKDSELYEKVIKTRIGKKALYKAIVVDPKVVVEKGEEKETLEKFRPLQKFAVAQACVSKMAKAGSDPIYGDILDEVCDEYKDKRWARVKIGKLMNKLVKYNPDKFADMYIANANDPNKNISDILDKNFKQNKQTLVERLKPKYETTIEAAVAKFNQDYEDLQKEQAKQNDKQITNLYAAQKDNNDVINFIKKGIGKCKTIEDLRKELQERGLDNDAVQKILEDNKEDVTKARKGVKEELNSVREIYENANKVIAEEIGKRDPEGELKDKEIEALTEAEYKNMTDKLEKQKDDLEMFNERMMSAGVTGEKLNITNDPSKLKEINKTDEFINDVNKDVEKALEYKAAVEEYNEDFKECKLQVINDVNKQISDLEKAKAENNKVSTFIETDLEKCEKIEDLRKELQERGLGDEVVKKILEDNKEDVSKARGELTIYLKSELETRKAIDGDYQTKISDYETKRDALDSDGKLKDEKVVALSEAEFGKKMKELEAKRQSLKEQGEGINAAICNVEAPEDLSTLKKPEQVGKFIEGEDNKIVKTKYDNFDGAYTQLYEKCKEQKALKTEKTITDLTKEKETNKKVIDLVATEPESLTEETIKSTIEGLELQENVKNNLINDLTQYAKTLQSSDKIKLEGYSEAYEKVNKEYDSIIKQNKKELEKLDPTGKLKDTTAEYLGDDQYNKNADQLKKIEEALVEYNKDKTIRETCEIKKPQPDLELKDVKSAETISKEVKEKVKKGLIAELENKSNTAEIGS